MYMAQHSQWLYKVAHCEEPLVIGRCMIDHRMHRTVNNAVSSDGGSIIAHVRTMLYDNTTTILLILLLLLYALLLYYLKLFVLGTLA